MKAIAASIIFITTGFCSDNAEPTPFREHDIFIYQLNGTGKKDLIVAQYRVDGKYGKTSDTHVPLKGYYVLIMGRDGGVSTHLVNNPDELITVKELPGMQKAMKLQDVINKIQRERLKQSKSKAK